VAILDLQDKGEEKGTKGFQEIKGLKEKRDIPETPVLLGMLDPPVPWGAGRGVHGR